MPTPHDTPQARHLKHPISLLHDVAAKSRPLSSQVHLFESAGTYYTLITDRSRVFRIDDEMATRLAADMFVQSEAAVSQRLSEMGIQCGPALEPLESHALTSISLAVAQRCNLGCTYCYAQEGDFGGRAKNMPTQVARESIDQLFENSRDGDTVHISFLGGEPLVNRETLRESTLYALDRAKSARADVKFSITTNGTLLTSHDADFFERHGFAVTVSIDGIGKTHDRLRVFKSGGGTFDDVIRRVKPLLAKQQNMQVSARVTVTPSNLKLLETLGALVAMGFHGVGFSPMLSSPTGRDQMDAPDLDAMLGEMEACGREFERKLIASERFPFTNMTTAMMEIHRGTHRPYPCGAGAGYMGVSADGGLFACHRFVDSESGSMGDIKNGIENSLQQAWLTDRHVDSQEPCNGCWARYLCGGGCHHEVIHRGRPACDFIRGWLHYCLQAYTRLIAAVPDYFGKRGL